jgi:hypothetical protein
VTIYIPLVLYENPISSVCTHYGKKRRCRATRLCHAALHGKDAFAVYKQKGRTAKNLCTVKLLKTHGKESLHGKTTNDARQRRLTRQRHNSAHGKE